MQKLNRIILIPLILLWLFVVVIFYYWGHQFAIIPLLIGLIRITIQLLILALIWLATFGIGVWLSRLLRLAYRSLIETIIFSLGLGVAVLSLVALGLGFAGIVTGSILWPVILLADGLAILWIIRRNKAGAEPAVADNESLQPIDKFFIIFIGLVLLIGLQLALAPPTAWDGLSTHLVLIDQILGSGAIESSQFTSQPIAGHLFFVWGMALGGETMPQLLSFSQGLIIIAAVAMFTQQHFGRRTAILAAAILCSVEVFIITAVWPYMDVPVGMFGFLSVLALINWQLGYASPAQDQASPTKVHPWLFLAVIFGVTAANTKLNGLFVYPVLLAGLLLALYWNRQQWRRILLDVVIAIPVGILLALLWMAVENVLQPASGVDVTLIASSTAEVAGELTSSNSLIVSLQGYLTAAWEMTIIGQQGALLYDGSISPFFLIFIPLLIFLPRKPKVVWSLMLAGAIEFCAWLVVPRGYYQNRHLILTYPIFSILAAYFISRLPELDQKRFSISGFFRILLVMVLVFQLLFFVRWLRSFDPTSYLTGVLSREQFLSRNLNGGTSPGYYQMMQTMNEELSPDSIVGVPWPEPRVFFCQMTCVRYPFPRNASLEQMITIARDQELSHILISRQGLEYWLDFNEDNPSQMQTVAQYGQSLEDLVSRYGELENVAEESFYLYSLDFE